MFNFSERFMEDCLSESPRYFIGEECSVVDRQPRMSGFIPDVILKGRNGLMLVEIQKNALDRFHLYKTLEYRDLSKEKFGTTISRVLLVCNEIEEKYRKLCATHLVDIIVISREEWLDIAFLHCPKTVVAELKSQAQLSAMQLGAGRDEEFATQFRPLCYQEYKNVYAYWYHLKTELERFGIHNKRAGRYGHLISDIEDFLERGVQRIIEDFAPTNWNIDKLLTKMTEWEPKDISEIKRIRKPRITLQSHITAKGNLSICWKPLVERPLSRQFSTYDVGDWAVWCGDQSYGWQRPPNELVFLHDFNHIGPHRSDSHDLFNWYVIDELILIITKKIHELIEVLLSAVVEIKKLTDFELRCESEGSKEHSFESSLRVIDWNIFYVEERYREQQKEFLKQFFSRHTIDNEKFVAIYNSAFEKRNRKKDGDKAEYLRRDLKEYGVSISKTEIELLLKNISEAHPEIWRQLRG